MSEPQPTYCCGNDDKCLGGCNCQCHKLQTELAIARATSVGPIQLYVEQLKTDLAVARNENSQRPGPDEWFKLHDEIERLEGLNTWLQGQKDVLRLALSAARRSLAAAAERDAAFLPDYEAADRALRDTQ